MKIQTQFSIMDKVIINNDHSVVALVQRIIVSSTGTTYEVSWFDSSGSFKEHTLYDWQLTRKED
jgi:hypothetical protein